VSKTFRPHDPEQMFLLPASLQDWLPKGHLAYFVSDVVDQLDLSAIRSRYEEERGYPPYHPAMMVKVLLYAYCIGVSPEAADLYLLPLFGIRHQCGPRPQWPCPPLRWASSGR